MWEWCCCVIIEALSCAQRRGAHVSFIHTQRQAAEHLLQHNKRSLQQHTWFPSTGMRRWWNVFRRLRSINVTCSGNIKGFKLQSWSFWMDQEELFRSVTATTVTHTHKEIFCLYSAQILHHLKISFYFKDAEKKSTGTNSLSNSLWMVTEELQLIKYPVAQFPLSRGDTR